MDLIGQTIGNYTIARRLGAGGMGEVYEAQQPAIGARVAIKVLNADATDPASAQRFLIEAQAVNRIQHDGVVKIIDAGYTAGDRPYLVMEFLDGASLAEVMKADRLPMGSACRVVADVLGVLDAAHREGIVHRDLKPHNIFLTRSGRTVVLDFGVAKLLDTSASVSLTLTGAILGTPAYMAPEQIQGEAIDGRADLYAIGVVLYELVTGRRPFDGDQTYEILTAHVERRPPPPRAIRPDIPESVQAVLITALAKDRDDRFATAAAMRTALLQAANELPAAAFAAIEIPGVAVRRTPTMPPTGSGPFAAASAELAATTVPMPVRGDRTAGAANRRAAATRDNGNRAAAGADATVRAKSRPALRSAPDPRLAALATAPTAESPVERVDDPVLDTIPEASMQLALPPPPGASTAVPRSRRPVVIFAIALGVGVTIAAFAIGKFIGRRDRDPDRAAVVAAGSDADVGSGSGPADADPALLGPLTAANLPPELEQRLIKRRLHLLDLRPEIVDLLRLYNGGGTYAAQAAQALPGVMIEIDRMEITGDLVVTKLLRVQALAAEMSVTADVARVARVSLERAQRAMDRQDPVAANDHLWRAEWWLERGETPPW